MQHTASHVERVYTTKDQRVSDSSDCSAALRGVLGVLQHPGPQFWGPAIGGSGKLVISP